MIQIECEKNGSMTHILVHGHVEYADFGKDVVCAGISTLIYMLVNCLDYNSPDHYFREINADDDCPQVCIDYSVDNDKIKGYEEAALTGFAMIADHYPKNVILLKKYF